ncbi:hypothetical protein DL93DRAFT_2165564 [Clavulina sp. PMI_390]|nr:hypothetical protein DL93DRAFT_2165564 [Clavulina sp. PMI_390]
MALGPGANSSEPPAYTPDSSQERHSPIQATPDDYYQGTETPTALHSYSKLQKHSGNVIGLTVSSFAANGASTPFFWTGSTISGTVSLELPSANSAQKDRIKSVNLELRCVRIISSSKGAQFDLGDQAFERALVIIPVTLVSSSGDDLGRLENDELVHEWSYTVQIPTTYAAQAKKSTMFPMPPTFSKSGFHEFTKYELQVTVKKGLLWSNEDLAKPLIVLPRTFPPSLPSPYFQAAYERGLPLPLPSTNPDLWLGDEVTLVVRIDNYEAEVLVKCFVPRPVYRARGTAIPIPVSLDVMSISLIASGSSNGGGLFALSEEQLANAYGTIYQSLRSAIKLSLEALYPIGRDASHSYSADKPLDELPHPMETGAEVIIEPVAHSVPLWDTGLAYTGGANGDKGDGAVEEKDEKALLAGAEGGHGPGMGVEAWLQGEIVSRANIMPDFISPNVRLAHAVNLRIESTPGLIVVSANPPLSSNMRKPYGTFGFAPPLLTLPLIITTHSLPGDQTRSLAPVPDY